MKLDKTGLDSVLTKEKKVDVLELIEQPFVLHFKVHDSLNTICCTPVVSRLEISSEDFARSMRNANLNLDPVRVTWWQGQQEILYSKFTLRDSYKFER